MIEPPERTIRPGEGNPHPPVGWLPALVGRIGAQIIYALIWAFGRIHRRSDAPWLAGPVGGEVIGDTPYRDAAEAEGLNLERGSRNGGLIPDFDLLRGDGFDPSLVHTTVRDFYEHTADYAMDVWSQSYFPGKVGLWLLVTTISRQVNQLNFPLTPLETALGISSEIIMLRRPDGGVRYTGWFRELAGENRVLYTGFYMTEVAPNEGAPCVKVVFPMPRGNATVLLRPRTLPSGALTLDSRGRRFGDAGFYRIAERESGLIRVWHVRTLHEFFKIYVDQQDVLRCDHEVRFWGMPVLRLHYKLYRNHSA